MKPLKNNLFACMTLSLGITTLSITAQVKVNKYTITGTIKNMDPMPSKVYLRHENGSADSAVVRNGAYQFDGLTNRLELARIFRYLGDRKTQGVSKVDGASLLLDRGDINIVSEATFRGSIFSGSGSEATNDYYESLKKTSLVGDTLKRLIESEEFKNDPDGQLQQAVSIKLASMIKNSAAEQIAYVRANPKSKASTFIVLSSSKGGSSQSAEELKTLFHLLSDVQQASIKEEFETNLVKLKIAEGLKKVEKEAHQKIAVGKVAEDFTQNDPQGNPVSLSSFKGKYVLVDFWASWCKPCRAENPTVVKAFNTYKDKGFTVLGISLDGQNYKTAWLEAIEKDGLNWPQVSDLKGFDNAVAKMYGINSIPQNFLVDPHGVIVAENLRGEALEKQLASIFK